MTARSFATVGLLVATSAVACAMDLNAAGNGKACSAAGRCASGYVCSSEGRCVVPTSGEDSALGAGDVAKDAAPAEAGPLPMTSAGGGRANEGSGGNGGTGTSDAGLPDAPPSAQCPSPTLYFPDDDADGFGTNDGARPFCERPDASWAPSGGDCIDSNDQVFPGQTDYFAVPYSAGDGDSFDYDCSGAEDADPTLRGLAANCALLGPLQCAGAGLSPTDRSGSGANPLCGSTELVECVPGLLSCGSRRTPSGPARCR